jgi:hypothetical protein
MGGSERAAAGTGVSSFCRFKSESSPAECLEGLASALPILLVEACLFNDRIGAAEGGRAGGR